MQTKLLHIGTRVVHDGHGPGTIVAHNGVAPASYAVENLGSPEVAAAVGAGLGQAIITSVYSSDRYPYVVHFDPTERFPDGYKDVYDVDGDGMKVLA
jgi:hypothetical protein